MNIQDFWAMAEKWQDVGVVTIGGDIWEGKILPPMTDARVTAMMSVRPEDGKGLVHNTVALIDVICIVAMYKLE